MMTRACPTLAAFVLVLSSCTGETSDLDGDTDDSTVTKGNGSDPDTTSATKTPGSSSDGDSDGDTEGDSDDDGSTTSSATTDDPTDTSNPTTHGTDTDGGDGPGIDDDFDGDLSLWQVHNPNGVTLSIDNGFLRLEPAANTLWYQGTSGPLLWQLVTGDFMVTADVTSRRLSNPALPPLATYRTGGLMARNPADATENYVFIAVGSEEAPEAVETKTTTNSNSVYDEVPWPGAEGELRVCRIGGRFEMLIRERGGTWQSLDVYNRPDLPDTLQVGPFGFANQADPDLRVSFEWVRFALPTQVSDCTQ
jgi:hypothetical protein